MSDKNKETIENNDFVCGAEFSPADVRDFRLKADADEEFPEEFELKMIRVKSQGKVGACVAFSLSSIIEYHNNRQNEDPTEMSTGWIYGNRRDQVYHLGYGMYVRQTLKSACKYGDVPQELFPYNIETPTIIELFEHKYESLAEKAVYSRLSGYYRVKKENEIKKALMTDGPVIFAIQWYSDIHIVNNIITSQRKKSVGGHCMVIYGWDKNGWKIQNSWGLWNRTGTAILPYDFPIEEAYGITDDILDKRDDIIKPYNSKFKKIIAKIINFILNLKNIFRKKKK